MSNMQIEETDMKNVGEGKESAEQDKKPEEEIKETPEQDKEAKKKGIAKWIFLAAGLILIVVLGLLTVGYIRAEKNYKICFMPGSSVNKYYETHFLPGSSVNGIACDNMTAAEVASLLEAQGSVYSLQVFGRDYATGNSSVLIGEILPEDISLSLNDSLGSLEQLLAEQEEQSWIQAYFGKSPEQGSYSISQGVQFDEDRLKEVVNSWAACAEENMLRPQDAYISDYIEEAGGYQIIPETISTTLAMDKVLSSIADAVYEKQPSVDLEQESCYIEPKVTQTDATLAAMADLANTWLSAEITYDWNSNEVILNREKLKEWIILGEDGPVLDEDAVESFVKEQAKEYDTYGKKKKFVTTLGVELTLNSPNYGWKTDTETETQELIELISQGSVAEREPVYSAYGRKKGAKDIGGDYVEADLTHQHLYLYSGGQIVLETDFVSGKMNIEPTNASPAGIFGLTYKTRNATLRGADYESFVHYWMPFFGNYGMHDATWRQEFGGDIYLDNGSHGCLNLPLDAAAVIYEYVSKGFPVICYYYEVDPLVPQEDQQVPQEF